MAGARAVTATAQLACVHRITHTVSLGTHKHFLSVNGSCRTLSREEAHSPLFWIFDGSSLPYGEIKGGDRGLSEPHFLKKPTLHCNHYNEND